MLKLESKVAKLFLRLCSLFIAAKEKTLADNEYQVSPLEEKAHVKTREERFNSKDQEIIISCCTQKS